MKDPALLLGILALLSPLATYLIAARKVSGRIKDSDATELWAESKSIRDWSAERMRELTEHGEELEGRLKTVEGNNSALTEENRKLIREVVTLRDTIADLRGQLLSLTNLLNQERAEVVRLRTEAEQSPRRRHSDPPITEEGGSDARLT